MLLAGAAALSYGMTIAIGRSLAGSGLGTRTVLGARFTGAAIALAVILCLRRLPLLPQRGERRRAFFVGAVGYMAESAMFFAALGRGTAGAVALLFYAYPSMVVLIELALGRARPSLRTWVALALSAAGTILVVTAGADVSISVTGALLALLAAVAFALYLLVGNRLVVRTNAFTTSAWVAGGAGLSFLTQGALLGDLHAPGDRWLQLVGTALATAAAFAFMFAALRRIGPGPTAVVMTTEALWAIVASAAFLHESVTPLQVVGGVAVLAATVLIGAVRRTPIDA